jgi:glutamyl-tRNA synthetase
MKTRSAPSPTGWLHLGNIRTILFNYLWARNRQGSFLLRIEDTDQARSKSSFIEGIKEDCCWLGLTWDDDVIFQSYRATIYNDYYVKLKEMDLIYPCFCSEERLATLRKEQHQRQQPPGYDGHCRILSTKIIKEKQAQGQEYTWRFRVPKDEIIEFQDLIKGDQRFHTRYFHDFIVQRSDGSPAFLFCNALDDALMGITHVLRGEDHLTNTPKQILLLKALNFLPPLYGHLPLITKQSSAEPLSKRENSLSVRGLRSAGYLPGAILNYLARLGHTLDSADLMSLEQLSQVFSIDRIQKGYAHFDEKHLNFWQKQAIKNQAPHLFWESLDPIVHSLVPAKNQAYFVELMQAMVILPREAKEWAQLLFEDPVPYTPEIKDIIQAIDLKWWLQLQETFHTLEDVQGALPSIKMSVTRIEPLHRKQYWKAIRSALTGRTSGPELESILKLLGIDRIKKRLSVASSLGIL